MSKYRTAIIACGMIARVHARGWQGVPGQPTEIGAIADTNADARREFGDFFDVGDEHRYSDYREMLDKERPDFVDICSWHQQHAEMVIVPRQQFQRFGRLGGSEILGPQQTAEQSGARLPRIAGRMRWIAEPGDDGIAIFAEPNTG